MANYSFNGVKENTVKAQGLNLNVSFKQAVEICNYVRGRSLAQAKRLLERSIEMQNPVPIKRFSNGVGHKPGMAAGRYYPKACSEILKVIKSAESNAKNKGMNAADMKLVHIAAQTAPKQWHYGRKKRSIFKAAHLEVVLQEVKGLGSKEKHASRTSQSSKPKAEPAKHEAKPEHKPEHREAKKQ